jgi:hypothetical protein
MHIEKREDPLVDMGYEIRDINPRGIRNAVLIFFGFALFSAVLGGIVYAIMNPRVLNGQPVAKYSRMFPQKPNPLLQTNQTAKTDVMELRQREDKTLADPPSIQPDGSYRIPIDAAMKLVLRDGGRLPGYESAPTPNAAPLVHASAPITQPGH